MIETTNFTLRFYWPISIRLQPVRMMKHFWQRQTRGFDDSELWCLDQTISNFIAPRLQAFADMDRMGYPRHLYPDTWSEEKCLARYQQDLDTMARAFEIMCDEDLSWSLNLANKEIVKKGLRLFTKYYQTLWD